MRILWVTICEPDVAAAHFKRTNYSGTWLNYSHELISLDERVELYVLSCSSEYSWININNVYYAGFSDFNYFEAIFEKALDDIKPDIVHVWGTEYEHFLITVNVMKRQGLLNKLLVSIQGLVSIVDKYYTFALPDNVCKRKTLYELLRHTSIEDEHKSVHIRGKREIEGLKSTFNCIGRTDWDKAITRQYNKDINYFKCNEILRKSFYKNMWDYSDCEKHSIVFSQSSYVLKGFHVLLDALVIVKKFYPDVKVYAIGKKSFSYSNIVERIKRNSFREYIQEKIIDNGLHEQVEFVGFLDESQMVAHYKRGNVFVCSSGIENSSNSVGEAMILGMPIVASDVGGIKTFIEHNVNGILYQADSVNMLADGIIRVFENTNTAINMGKKAREKAIDIYDPVKNTNAMISIYEQLAAE